MKSLFALFAIFILSCNNLEDGSTNKNTDSSVDNIHIATAPLDGCYTWTVNKDTALLSLQLVGNELTGTLVYDWNEKDRNTGTLKGIIKGDLIVAKYTFQSEGMQSVREVVFKIHNNSLVEGYGDYAAGDDTLRFADITKLDFQEDRPFRQIDCSLK